MIEELKHWSEDVVRQAVATVRRAVAARDLPSLTLAEAVMQSAAVVLADHTEWTYANLARRITLYMEGVQAGMDEIGKRNEEARSEAWAQKSTQMAAEVERLENELRQVRAELAALKAGNVKDEWKRARYFWKRH